MIKAVIITAAGQSVRMNRKKKELQKLKGLTVLERAVLPFVLFEGFDHICVTYPAGQRELFEETLHRINFPIEYVEGGETRQISVYNALLRLRDKASDLVLIHDGARPHVREELIQRVVEGTLNRGNSTPVTPSINAMKRVGPHGVVEEHLMRQQVVGAQTPQGFAYPEILEAHERARQDKSSYVDDSQIWSAYVGPAHTVEGDPANIKITYPQDLGE